MLKTLLTFLMGILVGAGVIAISVNAQEMKIKIDYTDEQIKIIEDKIEDNSKPVDVKSIDFKLQQSQRQKNINLLKALNNNEINVK